MKTVKLVSIQVRIYHYQILEGKVKVKKLIRSTVKERNHHKQQNITFYSNISFRKYIPIIMQQFDCKCFNSWPKYFNVS